MDSPHDADVQRRPRSRKSWRAGPSQSDVAALAGVSAQTVSRVANDDPLVREATRDRVRRAMDELDYVPNQAAQALRTGAFGAIGVIAHQLHRTGESRTVEAVVEAARAENHTVSLLDLEAPSPRAITAAAAELSHQAIDGLVIIRAELADPSRLALPKGLPVVVFDAQFAGRLPAVTTDHAGGTRAAVHHLLDLGHRTVHHVAGPPASVPASIRRQAWEDALRERAAPVNAPFAGDWTPAAGRAAAAAVARDRDVTAVFAANDEMAAGLIMGLHERGIRVPEEVSIVGFDNIPLAPYLWPPLTTVNQDFATIGKRLVEVLLAQIRGGAAPADYLSIVDAELVIRASTAPPRAVAS